MEPIKDQPKIELVALRKLLEPDKMSVQIERVLPWTEVQFDSQRRGNGLGSGTQALQSEEAQILGESLDDLGFTLGIKPDGQVATDSRRPPTLLRHGSLS